MPEVSRHDVEKLWSDVIAGRVSWQDTSARAEAMVELVNSESPVVNWGLLTLYYLWQTGVPRDAPSLSAGRDRWRAQLAEYDADPGGWMVSYFQRMLASPTPSTSSTASKASSTTPTPRKPRVRKRDAGQGPGYGRWIHRHGPDLRGP